MAKRTCSIEDCDRKYYGRGWCVRHYKRWYRNGDPLAGSEFRNPPPIDGFCIIDECNKSAKTRGWCAMHYARWLTYGSTELPARSLAVCDVDGCERTVLARGWCQRHYQRWRDAGDVGEPHIQTGRRDDVGYQAVHNRLRVDRGPASNYPCEHCGSPADHWAYDHSDPEERWGENRPGNLVPYSLNAARYISLCKYCHWKFDRS